MKKILSFLIVATMACASGLAPTSRAKAGRVAIDQLITKDTEIIFYTDYQKAKEDRDKYKVLEDMINSIFLEEQDNGFKELLDINSEMQEQLLEGAVIIENLEFDSLEMDMKYFYVVKGRKLQPYIDEYFVDEGDYYRLKDELAKPLEEMYTGIDDSLQTIFLKRYADAYIMSPDLNHLDAYIRSLELKEYNTGLRAKFLEMKKDSYNVNIVDLGAIQKRYEEEMPLGLFVDQLHYAYSVVDIEGESIKISYKIEGSGEVFDLLDSSQLTDRKLQEYVVGSSIYFANNNFGEFAQKLNSIALQYSGQDYLSMIEMMYQIDMMDVFDSIGNELVFNYGGSMPSVVLNNNDTNKVKEYLTLFGAMLIDEGSYDFGGNRVEVTEDKLLINVEELQSRNITNEENVFFRGSVDYGIILPEMSGVEAGFSLANFDGGIELKTEFNIDSLRKLIEISLVEASMEELDDQDS